MNPGLIPFAFPDAATGRLRIPECGLRRGCGHQRAIKTDFSHTSIASTARTSCLPSKQSMRTPWTPQRIQKSRQ
jgi:hypothetical protein